VIVRTPSGGHRGYGPTHSQSPEKHFLGIPSLVVAAASPYHDPREVYSALLQQDDPVLFIEHKLLYGEPMQPPSGGRIGDALARYEGSPGLLPTVGISWVPPEDCTVTVVAYGYSALLAASVLRELAVEEEIFGELLVPAQLAPLDIAPIERSTARTGSLITIEEGVAGWAWGSEVAQQVGRSQHNRLRHPIDVVTSRAGIIPSSRRLEQEVLVGTGTIESRIRNGAA
jgi:pyruvate/2-oxoglutarate/acetoin dehydrogenase E1 component